MGFTQRLLTLVLIPLVAILSLQVYFPESTRNLYRNFFPEALPPRSEIPLVISSVTHWSHFEKNAAVAVELAELGYPITFIVGSIFQSSVEKLHPNIKFLPFRGVADKMSEEDIATYMSLSGLEQRLFVEKKVFVDSIPNAHETLQGHFAQFRKKYNDSKPLISIYDFAMTGHHPVLLGAPGIRPDISIGISIAPLSLDSNDTYPFLTGKPPHQGPDAKEVHQQAYATLHADPSKTELDRYWWQTLAKMGVTRDPYPRLMPAMASIPDYLMTLGVPEFQFPRSDLRPNVRYFGAFKKVGMQEGKVDQLPSWWDDVLKAKKEGKKIIAVSQGTVEVRHDELLLPTLEALKTHDDILLIATFVNSEPEDVPGLVVPSNTRVAKFVPYDILLPLVDVLVSNGGYGAVMHCLRLGIPMVVAGVTQDKPETNAIIEYTGVGINLGVRQPGTEKIRDAVEKILGDEMFKTTSKALSKKFEKYDVRSDFDKLVSDVVRNWQREKQQKKVGRFSMPLWN